LGHARTFWVAWKRARENGGRISLRIEDLDTVRCKPEFVQEAVEELHWLGVDWDGEPVFQSRRIDRYLDAWKRLQKEGWIYPCRRSRKDLRALPFGEPGDEQDPEPIVPPSWRPEAEEQELFDAPDGVTWRFRIPEGEEVSFSDDRKGFCQYTAGVHFGDFSVWRRDGIPSYELAVVVDDIEMGITEVVRGEDLLRSTARQILLYRALGETPPHWCHEPLVRDEHGRRLAKRDQDRSLKSYREAGVNASDLLRDLL